MANNNSNNMPSIESVMEKIKTISSTLLSLGFVLYTIGYLITNSNLSRYGAHEIGLLEPSYLISGILFLFFWVVPILAPALFLFTTWSTPLEGMEHYGVIRVTRVMDLILFGLHVLMWYAGAIAGIMLLLLPTVKQNGEDVYRVPLDSFWFVLIQLGSLAALFVGVFNKPYKNVFDLISKRRVVLSIVSLISIFLFIKVVYPTVPAMYGGGMSQRVCLALADSTHAVMFSEIDIEIKENWTEPIDLVFEGEKTLTILLENDKVTRINKDLIGSIRFDCIDPDDP